MNHGGEENSSHRAAFLLKVVAQCSRLFCGLSSGEAPAHRDPSEGSATSTDGEVGPRCGLCVEGGADSGAGPALLLLLHRHHLLQQMADKGNAGPRCGGLGTQCPSYLTTGRHRLELLKLEASHTSDGTGPYVPGLPLKCLHRGGIGDELGRPGRLEAAAVAPPTPGREVAQYLIIARPSWPPLAAIWAWAVRRGWRR